MLGSRILKDVFVVVITACGSGGFDGLSRGAGFVRFECKLESSLAGKCSGSE